MGKTSLLEKIAQKFSVKKVWEIWVPNYDNSGTKYPIDYHYQWDEKVRAITGGLTILKTAKGQWISPKGILFAEEMIPVRIYCSKKDISKIVDITIEYYDQEAVIAYLTGSEVILRYKKYKK
jgi:hypothetical protein